MRLALRPRLQLGAQPPQLHAQRLVLLRGWPPAELLQQVARLALERLDLRAEPLALAEQPPVILPQLPDSRRRPPARCPCRAAGSSAVGRRQANGPPHALATAAAHCWMSGYQACATSAPATKAAQVGTGCPGPGQYQTYQPCTPTPRARVAAQVAVGCSKQRQAGSSPPRVAATAAAQVAEVCPVH